MTATLRHHGNADVGKTLQSARHTYSALLTILADDRDQANCKRVFSLGGDLKMRYKNFGHYRRLIALSTAASASPPSLLLQPSLGPSTLVSWGLSMFCLISTYEQPVNKDVSDRKATSFSLHHDYQYLVTHQVPDSVHLGGTGSQYGLPT